MNRRDLFERAAATGLAMASATAVAANPPAAKSESLDHSSAMTRYGALATTAARCVTYGEACLAHCIDQLINGNTEMKNCALTTQDVIAACTALQQLAVRNAPRLVEFARVCGKICRDCEVECRKHEEHPVCRDCRDSCIECAKECERIAG
jgi:Cys-rich four helix bundle protein (predicted Tat secretion target)